MESYKTWKNHRSEPYFTLMKNGGKTIEGRLRRGKYNRIAPGDHLSINNNEETDSFEAVVLKVTPYSTFRELLENEPFKKVLPNANNIEEDLKIYESFYTKDEEKKYGVVAIEVRKL
jgi:ASC-1-like (ASCH) protein